MKLRPRGYREFSDFMLAKVQFSSMAANINAAIKICDAFQKLHIRGLSYQDMNDGNFSSIQEMEMYLSAITTM